MAKKIDPANVSKLIELLGGKENIATLTHCITHNILKYFATICGE